MSNIAFYVPKLKEAGAWLDWRGNYKGGFGWRANVPLSQYRAIAVHHTDTVPSGNAKTDIDKIFREHVTNRGWGGIGYNLIITSEEVGEFCRVAYVGDLGSGRAHAPNEKGKNGIPVNQGNFYLVGVSIVCRNKDGYPNTEKQLRTLYYILQEFLVFDDRFTLLNDWNTQVQGHGYFDYTWCPDGQEGRKIKTDTLNIINNDMSEPSGFEKELEEAKRWKDKVLEKYGIDLMSKVDKTAVDREALLVILSRFTRYIQTSPALHPEKIVAVDDTKIKELEADLDKNEKELQDLSGRVEKFTDEQEDALKDDEKALKDRKESLEALKK